jgi:hypothetical protein
VGGGGVFRYGGFDGFLRHGTRVAEVDQGGEGVVAGGTVVEASGGGGDGYGEVVELVFEFEDDALGGFFADSGDASEGGMVAGADGGDESVARDAAEDRDGELGADAADGEELFEEALFLGLGEAEESDLVFANVGVDVQDGFGAFGGEGGEGGDADGDVVADAGAFEDGLIGGLREEASAEVGDHASGDCSLRGFEMGGGDGCAVKILKCRLDNYSNVVDS